MTHRCVIALAAAALALVPAAGGCAVFASEPELINGHDPAEHRITRAEYYQGLDKVLGEGALPHEIYDDLAVQTCAALDALYEAGYDSGEAVLYAVERQSQLNDLPSEKWFDIIAFAIRYECLEEALEHGEPGDLTGSS